MSSAREILAASPHAVFVLDETFRVRFRNGMAERIVGNLTADRAVWELAPFAGCDLEASCRRAVAQGTAQRWAAWTERGDRCFSFRIPTPRGGVLHLWCEDVSPDREKEREREILLSSIQAEADHAAIQARRVSIQTEAIFANISDGVVLTDLQANVLSMNPAALAFHGFVDMEQARRNVDEYREFELYALDGEMLPVHEWPLARILRGENLSAMEVELRRNDNGRSWFGSYSGVIARNGLGQPQYVMMMIRDVTVQKNFERDLRMSEERRRLALEAARMGTWNRDLATGNIVFSPRSRLIYGLDAEQPFHFSDLVQMIHAEDRGRIVSALERATRERQDYGEEFRVIRRDGSERWVASAARASNDAQGNPTVLNGVSIDITERKNTERALRESRETLRSVIDACPLAIFTVDRGGKVITWNTGAEKVLEWAEGEVTGGYAPCILDESDSGASEILQRVIGGEVISAFERKATAKSGREVMICFSAAPLRNNAGEAHGAVFVIEDVTERRKLTDRLRHAQKLESLGVLAGGVAHDFNNLLTGILGNASLAMDSMREDDASRPMLNEIVRASERAADLTRQLLAYAGKGRFITRPIDLSEHVSEICGLVHSSIPKKVHLVRDLRAGLPWMEGDPSQMQQIIMNLLINAAESIPADTPGTVLVSTRRFEMDAVRARDFLYANDLAPGLYVAFEVHDSGCGMDEETLARIFDPFFSTKFTGRGLGLSAVLGIVQGHKGGLRVTSREGKGTSFTLVFPADGESRPPAPAPTKARVHTSMDVRADLAGLERAGFDVAGFRGAHGRQRIHAVLMELGAEEEFEQMQRLYAGAVIVAATPYGEPEAIRAFPGWPAAGFIRMPWSTAELIQKLRTALRNDNAK